MTAQRSTGERRWPPLVALFGLVLLPAVVPRHLTVGVGWLVPILGSALVIAILAVDSERDSRRAKAARIITVGLTALLILAATLMTLRLLDDLTSGGPSTESGNSLLSTGALVWVNNNVLFAVLYWELDSGGPAARAVGARPFCDLAFPQQINPQIAPEAWRPLFGDYLYLGLTNALAFSPTDVMPLRMWAKGTMALQSLISFVLVGLVIANAVNVLT